MCMLPLKIEKEKKKPGRLTEDHSRLIEELLFLTKYAFFEQTSYMCIEKASNC